MIVVISKRIDAEEQCSQMLVNAVTLMLAIARVRTNGDDHRGHEYACILCETEERRNYVYDYDLRPINTYWDVLRTSNVAPT